MSGAMTAAAMGGTAILGYMGAQDAADAATQGAQASAAATERSSQANIDFQKWLWGEQTKLQQPYMEAGGGALSDVQDKLATGFQFNQDDPSYQFRLNQGLGSLESSAAAKGMQLSGQNLKDVTKFSQDYASTEYGNAYNRWQSDLRNDFSLAQMGQAAASGVAGQGGAMGAQVSSSIGAGGRAQSQMYSDVGNINAAGAMAPYNTLMDVGQMYASGGGFGGGGTQSVNTGSVSW